MGLPLNKKCFFGSIFRALGSKLLILWNIEIYFDKIFQYYQRNFNLQTILKNQFFNKNYPTTLKRVLL
ncbi:MAG: hypothetical protein COC08_05750 [Maribacter sp.]|nr:MAG: hypothetical protein COC08_05750 [Maribacter sp.]